jgi:hypothetical protein
MLRRRDAFGAAEATVPLYSSPGSGCKNPHPVGASVYVASGVLLRFAFVVGMLPVVAQRLTGGSQERVSQPHKGNDNQDVRPECNYALHDDTLTSVCEAVTAQSRLRDKPSANSIVHVWPVRTHRPWQFQEEQPCCR